MTELNETHNQVAAQPTPEWPDTAAAQVGDPSVEAAVATLDALPGMPVAGHEAIYSGLHDALLETLNEEPAAGNGGA
ncbi:hypothetical protein [Arthrobacter sp. B6]|uniref:hypothetical protein n=1 Tax=Arthrobacter sp. B6 TaxID=1570137 RepID=UPI00082D26A7|nr:hypothetical protein [Arthrobacter sp. B6]